MGSLKDAKEDFKRVSLPDKWKLVPAFLRIKGLVKQHTDSYNHFIKFGLKNIVEANKWVRSDVDPHVYLQYLDVEVGTPEVEEMLGMRRPTTPQECRLRDLTYSAPITVSVEYTRGAERVLKKGIVIGRIPVMLRSEICALSGKPDEELAKMYECPLDPGGYFIVKGQERVLLIHEQLSKNTLVVEHDPRGAAAAHVMSFTHERKSKTHVVQKKVSVFIIRHQLVAYNFMFSRGAST